MRIALDDEEMRAEDGNLRVATAAPGQTFPPELVEAVAQRVLERLSDKAVREAAREAVPRIAEKLIREALEQESRPHATANE